MGHVFCCSNKSQEQYYLKTEYSAMPDPETEEAAQRVQEGQMMDEAGADDT